MRVLFYDPGAERMGWAVIDGHPAAEYSPTYIDSGILKCERNKQDFQEYRLRLEDFHSVVTPRFLHEYRPDIVVNEIVPSVGGGNFVVATQSYLANTAIGVVHAIAFDRGYRVAQIGATTLKKNIGGSGKATKVAVRNGVLKILPELAPRRVDWIKVFDEPDAIAGALSYMQYKVKNGKEKG
jgi:Holliday junction resolvasome RuvABC endonuclease subunit